MDRYVSAAQKISRLAVGTPWKTPGGDTIRIPADRTQEEQVPGLPVGTRGGALIPYTSRCPASTRSPSRLSRDRNEEVEGLKEPATNWRSWWIASGSGYFTVRPPRGGEGHSQVDQHLKQRITVERGSPSTGSDVHQESPRRCWGPSGSVPGPFQPAPSSPDLGLRSFRCPLPDVCCERAGDTPSRPPDHYMPRPKKPGDEEQCARSSYRA